MHMEQNNHIEERTQDIISAMRMVARGIDMDRIKEFLDDGKDHGTVVEALYEALMAALSGEATTVTEALSIGASEWYK